MSEHDQIITEETHPTLTFRCISCRCEMSQEALQNQLKYKEWSIVHFCACCQTLIHKVQDRFHESGFTAGIMLSNHRQGYKSPRWGDALQAMIDDHKRIFPQWTYVVEERTQT